MKPLGIIAGQGQLPFLLIQACQEKKRPVFVLAYHGQTNPETVQAIDHLWLSLGEMGKGLEALKDRQVSEIVLAGRIHRPSLKELKTDWRGALFLARIGMRALGDDTLLQLILQELVREGFTVLGIQELLTSLQYPEGPLGQVMPSAQALLDIKIGLDLLKALSPCDVGQAVVVQQSVVLGIEAVEGTDELILRCGALQKAGEPAVLVKMAKWNQDERVDLPVIGPQTLHHLVQVGMGGLAFEAYKALVIEGETLKKEADKHGLFLFGFSPNEGRAT